VLPVAILAGGLGTRLRPHTETAPKAMIDINGQPFIAHQIGLLKKAGIGRVVVCIGHLGEMIRAFVGNGRRFGLDVGYSSDGPTLLGTAGAIRNALPLLGDRFFVLYGDSYLPCDYQAVEGAFLESGQPGLMTVFRNRSRWEKSNVVFGDGRILVYDKRITAPGMEHVDYGLNAFHHSAFSTNTLDAEDLGAIFQGLVEQHRLVGFEVKERFYEVGSWEGIRNLQAYLRKTAPRTVPE
jgi:MurNAc alpha-1-phosphate uridylyltransferase